MIQRSVEELGRDPRLRKTWEELGRPECYLAGGYIRDHVIGRESRDLDFTMFGSADEVAEPARRFAKRHGVRPHLLGKPPRCVWRIDTSDLKVELWPLGSLTLDDDILRRDFSCNALAWQMPDGPLIDRVGGMDAISAGRISAISRGNLQDDPVRLLRAPRFVAQLEGFGIDHRTTDWIRELAQLLAYAPKARIGTELIQILGAERAELGLRSMLELDLLRASAPNESAPDADWLGRHAGAVHRLASPQNHPVPGSVQSAGDAARLAILFRGWRCLSSDATAPYSWPRSDRLAAHRAESLLQWASAAVDAPAADRRELIHEAGDAFPALFAAAAALDDPGPDQRAAWKRWWHQWERLGDRLIRPPALLGADELSEMTGIGEGPELGRVIHALQRAQVRGQVRSEAGAKRWLIVNGWTTDHPIQN